MFFFEPVFELAIITVGDPGVPNKERIVMRPTESVNLGQFGVAIGIRNAENPNLVVPLTDNFFWLPSFVVEPPSWVFLYTGKGTYEETTAAGTSETAHVFHWGQAFTVFKYNEFVPVLFRLSGILIGQNPSKLAVPTSLPVPPVRPASPFGGLPRPRN